MQTVNPQRQMLGIMSAMDWPPKTVKFDSFYLLDLGDSPASPEWNSAEIPVIRLHLQWVWMNMGTDLQQGLVGRNRGDRYRTSADMRAELRKALYPGFCEKKLWTVTGGSITNLALQGASLDPVQFIWWDRKPTTMMRTDKDSGVVYGSVAVAVTDETARIMA